MTDSGVEIEKKFLLCENGTDYSTSRFKFLFSSLTSCRDSVLRKGVKIRQGYLPTDLGEELGQIVGLASFRGASEARLRDMAGDYFLTLKGSGGLIREESPDYPISKEAFDLYWSYSKKRVEKVRLRMDYQGHVAEVDVYSDRDLIVAEVEVESEEMLDGIEPLGKDVSEDSRYKNKSLARDDFHRKFILTGGPCCGKTLVANYLTNLQYPVIPESARKIIDEQLKIGGEILPWSKLAEFQLKVLDASTKAEDALKDQGTLFLDRGIPDGLAYCIEHGIEPPTPLRDAVRRRAYKAVFVLDPVPYRSDSARRESAQEAEKIHLGLLNLYGKLGYNPIRVPVNNNLPLEESVRERAHFIVAKSHLF